MQLADQPERNRRNNSADHAADTPVCKNGKSISFWPALQRLCEISNRKAAVQGLCSSTYSAYFNAMRKLLKCWVGLFDKITA